MNDQVKSAGEVAAPLKQNEEEMPKVAHVQSPISNETNPVSESKTETKGHQEINPPDVQAQNGIPVTQDDRKVNVERESLDEATKAESKKQHSILEVSPDVKQVETKDDEKVEPPSVVEAQKINDDDIPVMRATVDDCKTDVEKDSHSNAPVKSESSVKESSEKESTEKQEEPKVEVPSALIEVETKNIPVTQIAVDDYKTDVKEDSPSDAIKSEAKNKQTLESSMKELEEPSATGMPDKVQEERSTEAEKTGESQVLLPVEDLKSEIKKGADEESEVAVEKIGALAPQVEPTSEEQPQITEKAETLTKEVEKPSDSVVEASAEAKAKSEAPSQVSEQGEYKDVHVNQPTEETKDENVKNEEALVDKAEDSTILKEETTPEVEVPSKTPKISSCQVAPTTNQETQTVVDSKEDELKPSSLLEVQKQAPETECENGTKSVAVIEESKTQPIAEVTEEKSSGEINTGKDVEETVKYVQKSRSLRDLMEKDESKDEADEEIAKDEKPVKYENQEKMVDENKTAVTLKETVEENAKSDVQENETKAFSVDVPKDDNAATEESNTRSMEEVTEKKPLGENGTDKDVEEPAKDVTEKAESKDETVETKNGGTAKDEKPVKDENAEKKVDEKETAVKQLPESEVEVKNKETEGVAKDVPAVKPTQKQSNNIISKVKKSLVKAKKAIIGKSPSSKTLSPETKGETKVN